MTDEPMKPCEPIWCPPVEEFHLYSISATAPTGQILASIRPSIDGEWVITIHAGTTEAEAVEATADLIHHVYGSQP